MANVLHAAKLHEGAEAWNAWRASSPGTVPDLSDLNLPAGLRKFGSAHGGPIDLTGANLRRAVLAGADLGHARLTDADLSGADLRGVNLAEAHLGGTRLAGANLAGAWLGGVHDLTQDQVDRAHGCAATVLPGTVAMPPGWAGEDGAAPPTKAADAAGDRPADAAQGDPHSILGVARKASPREIRAAYLRLVKQLHPDGRAPGAASQEADERLKRINDAYQELKGFGGGATARKAERERQARRARAVFVAGVLTSVAPAVIALIVGIYYGGWLGALDGRLMSTAAPDRNGRPKAEQAAETGVGSERAKEPAGRQAAWTEAQQLGTREALERFVAAYPEGEPARQAKAAIAALDRVEAERREEAAAWAAAEQSGQRPDLERYVSAYPGGRHAAEARERIAAADRAEARRRAAAAAWATAEKSGDKGALQRFLADYPDSAHAARAREAIADIDVAEARRREEAAAWGAAEKSGSREGLRRFVESYPDGEHAAQARQALGALAAAQAQRDADRAAWAEAERSGTKTALRQYLANFPDGSSSVAARERVAMIEAEENEKDDAAWLKAERRHSKAAYAGYLTTYPDGRRAADARLRMAELERAEARLPAEPVKAPAFPGAPAARPRAPEAGSPQSWPSADEPFIGADGRIRR